MSQKPDYSQFKLFQQFFPDLIYRDPFDLLPPHLFPNILIKGNSAGEVLKSLCKSSPNLFNSVTSNNFKLMTTAAFSFKLSKKGNR